MAVHRHCRFQKEGMNMNRQGILELLKEIFHMK